MLSGDGDVDGGGDGEVREEEVVENITHALDRKSIDDSTALVPPPEPPFP